MSERHNRRVEKKLTKALDQSGAVAVIMVAALVGLCGFMALAVDVGHMLVVKAELQRTADAAVLAGVAGLVPYTDEGTYQTPNWVQGQTKAHTMIAEEANKADNLKFTDTEGTVDYGYWLLKPPSGYVQLPLPKAKPTTQAYLPMPALIVTLSRNVTMYLAPVIGISSPQTVSATAIAILPEGYSIAKNTFTMAVRKDIVFNPDQTINIIPQDFGWGDNGQWFNLDGSNDVPTIRRNDQINGQQQIYIAPGAKATLYDSSIIGQTIIVPVVDPGPTSPPPGVPTKTWQTILGFAAFKVTGLGNKSIDGHFVTDYHSPDAIPGEGKGTYLGVSGTPRIVSP